MEGKILWKNFLLCIGVALLIFHMDVKNFKMTLIDHDDQEAVTEVKK